MLVGMGRYGNESTYLHSGESPTIVASVSVSSSSWMLGSADLAGLDFFEGVVVGASSSSRSSSSSVLRFLALPVDFFGVAAAFLMGVAVPFLPRVAVGIVEEVASPAPSIGLARNASASRLSLLYRCLSQRS